MAILKRSLGFLFARVEAVFEWGFGQQNNPLACLGSLGWYFFWIVAGSGVYLYVFFDTGITDAYTSVQYITHEQWYAAGVMRSLHRYASDALVVVVVLHLLREFSLDRLRGKRFFPWLTGVVLLCLVYVCGITGYWLVWDELAQYIAISTAEWLDALPIFGEPIANNFLNSSTLGGRFFTLMVFMHIFAPLAMLLLMWIHIQRHARARVNPPRPLAIGTAITLLALALFRPAVSQGPADLDVVPATINLDAFYLAGYPLLDVLPGGQLWLAVALGIVILAILPWLPPAKATATAVVSLDNCNGCARCFEDCPYSAITMEPRSDGAAFATEAVVNTDLCMSCGICAGACPTATPFRRASAVIPGIELPNHSIAALRERTVEAATACNADPRVLIYACEHSGADRLHDHYPTITMPCVGMLPPAFVDFVLSRHHADGVVLSGCARGDCYYRLGDVWTQQRMDGRRDPFLRRRVARERLLLCWLPEPSTRRRLRALAEFQASLERLPPVVRRGDHA